MSNPTTIKLLIIAEATRIIELLNILPDDDLVFNYNHHKEKAELKKKMAELRRDTMTMQMSLNTYVKKEATK